MPADDVLAAVATKRLFHRQSLPIDNLAPAIPMCLICRHSGHSDGPEAAGAEVNGHHVSARPSKRPGKISIGRLGSVNRSAKETSLRGNPGKGQSLNRSSTRRGDGKDGNETKGSSHAATRRATQVGRRR